MLCDELFERGVASPIFLQHSMRQFIERIKGAVKFDLAEDFAQVADELSAKPAEIVKVLPFCRLPYKDIWMEVAWTHRPHFLNGRAVEGWQAVPTRVGWLLSATNDALSEFTAHMFWKMDEPPLGIVYNAATFAMKFNTAEGFAGREGCITATVDPSSDSNSRIADSWSKLSEEEKNALSRAVCPMVPDYNLNPAIMQLGSAEEIAETVIKLGRGDWAGEPGFLEAALGLMNARNASEDHYVDNTDFNRRRIKRGQRELSSHHVLRIHARQRAMMKAASQTERNAELRSHFVRGHWKVRKTGIYFWRPFMRGRSTAGVVTKDYVVTE